ncbi:MAG: OsmC family protein [Thermoplasmata archaeon]|nr:OsmC family protein [Candidatus Sysuiplasma acidicola]MDH2905447.1 OsmC family protein [Methanomassiliicoccales archaeon]
MARIANNLSLDIIEETSRKARANNGSIPIEKEVVGTFSLIGSPMFTATLHTDYSDFLVSCDEPSPLGGKGVRPSPLAYMLYGVLACYTSTLAIQCAVDGIELKELKVKGTLSYDIGPIVVENDIPIIKKLKIEVIADRDIRKQVSAARKRCPAVFAVEHPIETEILEV